MRWLSLVPRPRLVLSSLVLACDPPPAESDQQFFAGLAEQDAPKAMSGQRLMPAGVPA